LVAILKSEPWEPLKLEEFKVTVSGDGMAKIEGQVNTLYDKYRVYDIVSRARGVKNIENLLVVNTPTVVDDMIESNIIIELRRVSSILEPDRIKVHVDNGIVILRKGWSEYRPFLIFGGND